MPTGMSHSGVVGSRRTLAQDKNPNQAPNPETNLIPQTENQNPGIIWEHLSRQGGENQITSPPLGDLGVLLAQNPDPLAASFYKQELQARASAPPPHILTPEEVKALDEEYARQQEGKQLKPSTFGKMYFKEKGPDYHNLE